MSERSVEGSVQIDPDGPTPTTAEVLESHGADADEVELYRHDQALETSTEGSGVIDTSTCVSRERIGEWIDSHLDEQMIVSSRSIAADCEDLRPQAVGKALAAKMAGETPEEWLDWVEVGKWRDTSPIKWQLRRLDGEAPEAATRARPLAKVELAEEIGEETGIEVPRRYRPDSTRIVDKFRTTKRYMVDLIEAVCDHLDTEPGLSDHDDGSEKTLDELTKGELSAVLERVTGWTVHGCPNDWNRDIYVALHQLLVEQRPLSEVDAP